MKTWAFSSRGINTDGIGHRYIRPGRSGRPVKIDLLAPDGVGNRADLTTSKPGRTVQVPAGTQLLHRTERVLVKHGRRVGELPRPTLLAAIVGKAAACKIAGQDNAHYQDLALLCSLLDDPFSARDELDAKDRKRIVGASDLLDVHHRAWAPVPNELRPDGQVAFQVLSGR